MERIFTTHKIWGFTLTSLFLSACGVPKAAFKHPQTTYTAPATIAFENTSSGGEAYEWDFGDGTELDTLQVDHTYRESGNYLVTLKAKKGDKESVSQEYIAIRPPNACTVILETEFGNMTIELYDEAPKHQENFLKLIREGYYHDLLFHRVVPGFVVQGGDPNSRNATPGKKIGTGEPGYKVPAEFSYEAVHVRGALAAARDNNPEKASSGSQFYIVAGSTCTENQLTSYENSKGFKYSPEQRRMYLEYGGTPQLDMEYTVFGRVVDGLEVIDKITAVRTKNDRPQKNVTMRLYLVD